MISANFHALQLSIPIQKTQKHNVKEQVISNFLDATCPFFLLKTNLIQLHLFTLLLDQDLNLM